MSKDGRDADALSRHQFGRQYAHPGEELDAMSTHRERAKFCYAKVKSLRNRYYERMAHYQQMAVESVDNTVRRESVAVRKQIGASRWGGTVEAKDLIGQEQMWTRWAMLEATMSVMEGPREIEYGGPRG